MSILKITFLELKEAREIFACSTNFHIECLKSDYIFVMYRYNYNLLIQAAGQYIVLVGVLESFNRTLLKATNYVQLTNHTSSQGLKIIPQKVVLPILFGLSDGEPLIIFENISQN